MEIFATIENRHRPDQSVSVCFLKEGNVFVTSGIGAHFGKREIMIPAWLMVKDHGLMGAILASILERLSLAHESNVPFVYATEFTVMDQVFTLTEADGWMRLDLKDTGEAAGGCSRGLC